MMKQALLATVVLGAALAGCGGGASSTPSPAPTSPAGAFVMTYASVQWAPTPYPSTASQITFPAVGTSFNATVQANGGTPPYNYQIGAGCGTGATANVSVARVGTNQFTITPAGAGSACPITFSDSSVPTQSWAITAIVNAGGSVSVS